MTCCLTEKSEQFNNPTGVEIVSQPSGLQGELCEVQADLRCFEEERKIPGFFENSELRPVFTLGEISRLTFTLCLEADPGARAHF